MPNPFPPLHPGFPHFMHGGDYNPDQWLPDVWDDDMRLMRLSHCNTQTLAIFSWVHLEPEEGRYTFDWLDSILDKLNDHGYKAVLATPTAAPPAWMSRRYPEILRVGANRVRRLHGNRVNTCLTAPLYREKSRAIATTLAERYKDHPALVVWHVFNEYGGDCHCDRCQNAFRGWLRAKFGGDLDRLNAAYWTAFWGHTYTDWEQIESPGGPYGEDAINGLTLDWKRFVTDQTVAGYRNEADALRAVTPDIPVTTNLMGTYPGLNYWKFAPHMDVVSWDSYPFFHDRPDNEAVGIHTSFLHDLNRSFKGGRPFMLMESTPSSCNWMPAMKLKRPGVHLLASLQAVAHGADTVQYFQWRQSRGGMEKYHGAVVAHNDDEKTRVFRDVAEVGETLERLDEVIGTSVRPEVALVYDWENQWAIEGAQGPRAHGKDYQGACLDAYRPFWRRGIPVDVIEAESDFSPYRLLLAPMLYMVKPGVAERLEAFVQGGGTVVATYWSGIVDENDLAFLGGRPGPLRALFGVWSEEIDALYDDETNRVEPQGEAAANLGLTGAYEARVLCDLIHAEAAETLATYERDFYAGRPALTVNRVGTGQAFYVASRNDERFHDDFLGGLAADLSLKRNLAGDLPRGVTIQRRSGAAGDFLFALNFTREAQTLTLEESGLTDALTGEPVEGTLHLSPYGSRILLRR